MPVMGEQENVTLFTKPPAGRDRQHELSGLARNDRSARRGRTKGEFGVGNVACNCRRRAAVKFSSPA